MRVEAGTFVVLSNTLSKDSHFFRCMSATRAGGVFTICASGQRDAEANCVLEAITSNLTESVQQVGWSCILRSFHVKVFVGHSALVQWHSQMDVYLGRYLSSLPARVSRLAAVIIGYRVDGRPDLGTFFNEHTL